MFTNLIILITLSFRMAFENREIVELVNKHFLFWVQSSGGTAGKQGKPRYVTNNYLKLNMGLEKS